MLPKKKVNLNESAEINLIWTNDESSYYWKAQKLQSKKLSFKYDKYTYYESFLRISLLQRSCLQLSCITKFI